MQIHTFPTNSLSLWLECLNSIKNKNENCEPSSHRRCQFIYYVHLQPSTMINSLAFDTYIIIWPFLLYFTFTCLQFLNYCKLLPISTTVFRSPKFFCRKTPLNFPTVLIIENQPISFRLFFILASTCVFSLYIYISHLCLNWKSQANTTTITTSIISYHQWNH